jgi:hypothetical protein
MSRKPHRNGPQRLDGLQGCLSSAEIPGALCEPEQVLETWPNASARVKLRELSLAAVCIYGGPS